MCEDTRAARHRLADQMARLPASRAVIDAFRAVPRERFVGAGPWLVSDGRGYRRTPDADPVHLYANVRVALDPDRELNNGRPLVHARWISLLDPRPGDRVVHVGAGTGYYTAILAEIVGPRGRVTAIEIDEELARRAAANVAHVKHVRVLEGDGLEASVGEADAIYINAGLTRPPARLLGRLRPAGRMILPLMALRPHPRGALFLVRRTAPADSVQPIQTLRIYPTAGHTDSRPEAALAEALARGGWERVSRLREDAHPRSPSCWLHGPDFCLSHEEPPGRG